MKSEMITKSVVEFYDLMEDVSRGDLQGIVEVRAAEITGAALYSDEAWAVSEEILRRLDDMRKNKEGVAMNLNDYVNPEQLGVMRAACWGEEGQHFIDKIEEVKQIIATMPVTYGTDGQSPGETMTALHYFLGGSDWWITERDVEKDQLQAFGFVCLNGDGRCAELGYISIVELLWNGAELDLYYKPESLLDLRARVTL